jgi:hypothetical protein
VVFIDLVLQGRDEWYLSGRNLVVAMGWIGGIVVDSGYGGEVDKNMKKTQIVAF